MVLTLFEEKVYEEQELIVRIQNILGNDTIRAEAAFKALAEFTLARSNVVNPRRSSEAKTISREDHDEDDQSSGNDNNDRIPLLKPTSYKRWKVGGLVGSGMLEGVSLQIEVLPKIIDTEDAEGQETARRSLLRMWEIAEGRPNLDQAAAGVEQVDSPQLHEWLIERLLDQLETLIARGIRLQYVEREDNLSVCRGRLLPRQNMIYNQFAPHRFYCLFDELSPNRPENRLIRAALDRVTRATSVDGSRRRARSLAERLHEIPPSTRIRADFAAWRDNRLMKHYREIRFTCSWILNEESPAPLRGKERMFGCFVRTSKLFEDYVAQWISLQLRQRPDRRAYPQEKKKFCRPADGAANKTEIMQPDLLIKCNQEVIAILDTKWKRPKAADSMSRADLYQMISYARFFLPVPNGNRSPILALIYPSVTRTESSRNFRFEQPMNEVRLAMHWFKLPVWSDDGWDEGIDINNILTPDNNQEAPDNRAA